MPDTVAADPPTTIAPAAAPAPAPAAPAPATAPAAPTARPRAAATPAPPAPSEKPWQDARRDRQVRQDLGQALGRKIRKGDDITAVMAEHREKTQGWKAERDALRGKVPTLESQLTAANTALRSAADYQLSGLPEAAREAIKAAAGDNPAEIIKLLAAARALAPAAPPAPAAVADTAQPAGTPAAPPPAPAARPPVPPGVTTTTAGGAPPPASPTSPVNHKAVYEKLTEANPMDAAIYAKMYGREIWAQPPA